VHNKDAVIAVRNVQAANLAWELLEAAKPHMNAGERNYAFVNVGAGDTFAAIRSLINLVGAKRIPLPPHLVQLCATWLHGYAFHDEHEHLRGVVENLLRLNTIQASPATRRLATPPRPVPLLTLRSKLRTRRSAGAMG
jgi:hypothetical protein